MSKIGLTEYSNFSLKRITILITLKNTVLYIIYHFTSKIITAKINEQRMIIGEKNYLPIFKKKQWIYYIPVYDAMKQKWIKVQIKAHKSPILKMGLNYEGHLGKILFILILRIS